jgi:hypothetical protein
MSKLAIQRVANNSTANMLQEKPPRRSQHEAVWRGSTLEQVHPLSGIWDLARTEPHPRPVRDWGDFQLAAAASSLLLAWRVLAGRL